MPFTLTQIDTGLSIRKVCQALLERKKRLNGTAATVFANNGTATQDWQKNKILSITCDKDTIVPDETVTYTYLRKDKKKAKINKDNKGKLIPIILSSDSKLDIVRQNKFINALYKFGWGKKTKNLANKTSDNKNLDHCKSDPHHWNQLHIQGFEPNYKTTAT